jgi:hypothetical protein
MRIHAQKDIKTIHNIITNYYDDYNIIHNGLVNDDVYFIVVEKFFFRNSSRASLSIVLTSSDDRFGTIIEAVGSGGGQGMFFKFDLGAKESFEAAIPKLLSQNNINYKTI